jgi:hypothetical protein
MVIAFICFFVPETKGRALEKVAGIFNWEYADGVARSAGNKNALTKEFFRSRWSKMRSRA